MTLRTPSDNILDKLLKLLGKKREVVVPEGTDEIYKEKGPYVQMMAKKEGFFKVLFRKNT